LVDSHLELLSVGVVVPTVHQAERLQVRESGDGAQVTVNEPCRFVEEEAA